MAPPPPLFDDFVRGPRLTGALALAFTGGVGQSASAAPPGEAPVPQRPSASPPALPDPAPASAPVADPGSAPGADPGSVPPTEASPPALPDPGSAPGSDPGSVPSPSTTPTAAAAPDPNATAAPAVAPPTPAATPATPSTFDEIFEASDVPSQGEEKSQPQLLAPTDKRKFFSLSLGTQAGLVGLGYFSYYGLIGGPPMRIETSVGAHFQNNPEWGAAFVISDTLGFPFNTVQLGARFQRDRLFVPQFGIYSQTQVTISLRLQLQGYGLLPLPYGFGGALEVGWGAKFVLADRLSLIVRPVAVELAGDTATLVGLNWNPMVGVGTVW